MRHNPAPHFHEPSQTTRHRPTKRQLNSITRFANANRLALCLVMRDHVVGVLLNNIRVLTLSGLAPGHRIEMTSRLDDGSSPAGWPVARQYKDDLEYFFTRVHTAGAAETQEED